jgi:hypothetical protein
LLVTAEWHLRVQLVDAVNPGSSSVELVCGVQRAVDVLREDGGSETVCGVVGLLDYVYRKVSYN